MMTLFVPLLVLLADVIAAEQACYGLDGTALDSTYGPCNPGARHSGCCAIHRPPGSTDICLDNGLCMATNGQYMGTIWQDGCTDPTGQDPGCPKLCPDARTDFDGLTKVVAWNVQMCEFGSYCCRAVNDDNNCCNNSTAPKVQVQNIGAFQFETSTAGLSTTSSPVSSSTLAPSTVFATAVSTGEPFQQTPTSESTAAAQQTCEKDKSAMVGGVVGSLLGATILTLVATMVWLLQKEKRQRKLKEHYEEQFGQTWAYRRTILVESDSRERVEISSPDDEKQRMGPAAAHS
ncbi:hypothetical protein EJ04DRAFT_520002 [Polyplosphaeria fusca]|uniref:Uncharacterized protein n=1 Tax=Polyplosphaeria fusca TaxID=682080 RepID=A0A9P4R9D5_9PLEO|nr:hypothetical protein EJ04DRAFT_520002 [Polyplosphaeria fusca]